MPTPPQDDDFGSGTPLPPLPPPVWEGGVGGIWHQLPGPIGLALGPYPEVNSIFDPSVVWH